MINLLPTDTKQTYRFARRNRILRRWVITMAFCLLGAIALTSVGYFYMRQLSHNYNQQIATANQQLQSGDFKAVDNQVKNISNNLKLVNQVLSKEILFSELLKKLGTATPNNVILTGLQITQATGGLDLTAQAANYTAATQLQLNLADPNNQIFSKADIVNIDCGSQGQQYGDYPCSVNIRALFGSNSPFLFINSGKGATK